MAASLPPCSHCAEENPPHLPADTGANAVPLEKPRNGWAGLKYWRFDLPAGLAVSLISLPFSLGIAVASGAPPICGLISAIIAGLLFPFLGGPFVTISGPAAGLAPILFASIATLGRGNAGVGYPLLLAVICMAGLVQVVLSALKAARFSAFFPSSVVEGMLCAIGLLIMAKELPHFIGVHFHAHEFSGILLEAPRQMFHIQPHVLLIGAICLGLLFILDRFKPRCMKVIPPPLLVVIVGILGGRLLNIAPAYLIHIPDAPLAHGLTIPDFQGLLADRSLWGSAIAVVITLTLIDGIESLATVAAVDKIDPFRRTSDPNRTLLAMGVSNICSSLGGGLTIIPGGVKSKVCIANGGCTLWANFYNAIFLLLFLFVGKGLINLIPFSALAAILIHTGYRMSEYRIWSHVTRIGREQLMVFSATVLGTLAIDLLWGIALGIVVKLLLNVWFALSTARPGDMTSKMAKALRLFRNPVLATELVGNEYHVYFGGPMVCFNVLHVQKALADIPKNATQMFLHITQPVSLIDHTTCENLLNFADNQNHSGSVHVEFVGLNGMRSVSQFASAMRVAAWDQSMEMA